MTSQFKCIYCGDFYTTKFNLDRHQKKSCPKKYNILKAQIVLGDVQSNTKKNKMTNISVSSKNKPCDIEKNKTMDISFTFKNTPCDIEKNKMTNISVKLKNKPCDTEKNKISLQKYIPMTLRINVWNTYIGPKIGQIKCPMCQQNEIQQLIFHCSHIIPKCHGGSDEIENLRPICSSCNQSIGTQNLILFAQKYFPKAPIHATFDDPNKNNTNISRQIDNSIIELMVSQNQLFDQLIKNQNQQMLNIVSKHNAL